MIEPQHKWYLLTGERAEWAQVILDIKNDKHRKATRDELLAINKHLGLFDGVTIAGIDNGGITGIPAAPGIYGLEGELYLQSPISGVNPSIFIHPTEGDEITDEATIARLDNNAEILYRTEPQRLIDMPEPELEPETSNGLEEPGF